MNPPPPTDDLIRVVPSPAPGHAAAPGGMIGTAPSLAPIIGGTFVPPAPQVDSDRRGRAPLPEPSYGGRPTAAATNERQRRIAVVSGAALISVLMHAAVLAVFLRTPAPLASIGIEAISVELALGADSLAGRARSPGQSETASAAAAGEPEKDKNADDRPDDGARPNPADLAKATDAKPVAPAAERSAAPAIAPPADPVTPVPDVVADDALKHVATLPQPPPPEPPSAPRKLKPKDDLRPKPASRPQAKPVAEPQAKQAQRKPRLAALTAGNGDARRQGAQASASSVASSAASGVGRGRSDRDTNYRGLVAAHLARYKQFPADARARGAQGATTVSFSLDGGGRVTSVSLGRASGVASLDQETTAMVRRASPFPAPPDGRPKSFTVPVSFYLR